jgi:hypothetical protein
VVTVKPIGIHPNLDESPLGVAIGGVSFEKSRTFDRTNTLVHGRDEFFFAGEIVIDDAGAHSCLLGQDRHGSVVKSALNHEGQHRFENGLRLVKLCFGSHALCASTLGPNTIDYNNFFLLLKLAPFDTEKMIVDAEVFNEADRRMPGGSCDSWRPIR